jgi:hypothetical protein
VGHDPLVKCPAPRAGVLGRPSPPCTESPLPTDCRHAHRTAAAPVSTAPVSRHPTCTHIRHRPYPVLYQSQVHLLLLAASPHSTAASPTSLCTEGRQQVATPPAPLAAVLVRHHCPESALVHASSCTAAMCLQSTTVASTAGLTIERRLRPSSCPAHPPPPRGPHRCTSPLWLVNSRHRPSGRVVAIELACPTVDFVGSRRHRAMERLTPLFPFVAESEA